MKPRFASLALVLMLAALLSVPVGASAVHWPNFGGDAGRSSNQPVDAPDMPIESLYRKAEGLVQTSIITSAGGPPTVQRMIYGTIAPVEDSSDFLCRVHLQVLATGAPVGPEDGVEVCSGTDAGNENGFGTRSGFNSVTPVESSSAGSLGQVYVVHNDTDAAAVTESSGSLPVSATCTASTNDIAIAQIDETDGTLVKDVAVGRATAGGNEVQGTCGSDDPLDGPITNGFKIESSPLITPADTSGSRDIFFVASNGTTKRLFKVHITNASAKETTITSSYVTVSGANALASPALAYFRDPSRGGTPSQYVVVPAQGSGTGGLASYRTVDLAPGPRIPEGATPGTDTPWTPAIPTTATGILPGQAGSGSDVTDSIYVAFGATGGKTIVRRFEQAGDNDVLTRVGETEEVENPATLDSPELAGTPSRAMALRQVVVDGQAQANGRVVVSTSGDIYALNADSLALLHQYRDGAPDDADLTTNGFSRTVPMVAGEFAYINQANGFPLALRIDPVTAGGDGMERVCFAGDLRPDCAGQDEFTENPQNITSVFAIGQGSISRNFIQLATDRGVFVYAAVDPTNAPATIDILTSEGQKLRGNAADARVTAEANDPDGGISKVEFFLSPGCAAGETKPAESKIGEDTEATNGDEFSVTFNTTECAEGEHTLRAVADSGNSPDPEDTITVEIDNVADPTASFTVAPGNEAPTGTEFTFDASASTPTGDGQAITEYDWDWEGDGTFDFEGTAENKVVKHTYPASGTYEPTLRIRQTNGEDDTEFQTVTVTNRPPVASFVASPNPAQAGQVVSFDGSASQDPDGQITKYEWDFDGDNAFDETTNGPTTKHTYQSAGKRTVTLRVTDTSGATGLVARDVEVGGPNVPPTASFAANPNPADVNRQVVFDGTPSRDPDGSIVRYEWDLDGNGTYETNSGSNPRTQRAYGTPGIYNIRLRVTDNSAAQTEAVRQLVVTLASSRIERVRPRSLSARTTPSRDRSLPYVFKTSGRLSLPAGVSRRDGCTGRVRVQFKVGKKTISARTTRLRSSCTYRTSVTFRDRKRIGSKATRLRVIVRYQGNKRLTPRSARTRTVRVG